MDRALPTLKTCVDQIRLHETLLHLWPVEYISDCLYFKLIDEIFLRKLDIADSAPTEYCTTFPLSVCSSQA